MNPTNTPFYTTFVSTHHEQLPGNRTILEFHPSGGIGLTFALNLAISAIAIFIFFVCFRRLAVFNMPKKRKLLAEYKKYMLERKTKKECIVEGGEDYTYEELEDNRIHHNGYEQERESFWTRRWKAIKKKARLLFNIFLSLLPIGRWSRNDDERLFRKYGREATVYLNFQKQMIHAVWWSMLVAFLVLLPLHMTGRVPTYELGTGFGGFNLTKEDFPLIRTTVQMVIGTYWKLYFHVVLSCVICAIFGIYLYKFYYSDIVQNKNFAEDIENREPRPVKVSKYAVQAWDLPKDFVDNQEFFSMVNELFPNRVLKTVLILDTSQRIKLNRKHKKLCSQIERYEYIREKTGRRPKIFVFGRCSHVDALQYYEEKRNKIWNEIIDWDAKYEKYIKREKKADFIQGTGIGYIIFKSPKDAAECLERYATSGVYRLRRGIKKLASRKLTTGEHDQDKTFVEVPLESTTTSTSTSRPDIPLKVRRAQPPDDINWDNLMGYSAVDSIISWIIQIVFIFVLIFFTTPLSIASGYDSIQNIPWIQDTIRKFRVATGWLGDTLFQYLPTLLLLLVTITFPLIVYYITAFEKYRSLGVQKRKVLTRLYIYLLLSTLVMPTMLLTSFSGLIIYIIDRRGFDQVFRNLFLPVGGAFFINFMLQAALLTNLASLIRVMSLVNYLWYIRKAVTPKEKLKATEALYYSYEYEYPYIISYLAIGITYSVFCPVILVATFFYQILKYFVDRYMLRKIHVERFNRRKPQKETDFTAQKIQTKQVVSLMIVNLILFALYLTVFFGFKTKSSAAFIPHTVFQALLLGGLLVTFAMFKMFSREKGMKFVRQFVSDSTFYHVKRALIDRRKKAEGITITSLHADTFLNAYEPPFEEIFKRSYSEYSKEIQERADRLQKHQKQGSAVAHDEESIE